MKKILILSMLAFSMLASSQNQIVYHKDKMTDREYAYFKKGLMCSEDGKKGFILSVNLKYKEGKVEYNGISIKFAGIGGCNENDKLIILFEDDTKITMESWNKFNCEGSSYFDLYAKMWESLSTKKIKAIRFQNGRSLESYTYDLKPEEGSYMIQADSAIKENKFITEG